MKLLGAVIAGGSARRFGSDKAAALLNGKALIDHAIDGLSRQVDKIVIVGRAWGDCETIADYPQAGGGPLLGLCGAVRHAAGAGFDAVLTCGCDTLPIPHDMATQLAPGPAIVDDHWLFGLWPVALAAQLERHIAEQKDRSLRHWIATIEARRVAFEGPFQNYNAPHDLK